MNNKLDQIQKLGGKNADRVCLLNRKLLDLGFAIGDRYNVTATPKKVTITADANGKRRVGVWTNHGKGDLPWIDLRSCKSYSFIGWGTHVRVRANEGVITVTPFNNGGEA